MSIQFRCHHCNKRIEAPDAASGKQANCPVCGQTLEVPIVKRDGEEADLLAGLDEFVAAYNAQRNRSPSSTSLSVQGANAELPQIDVAIDARLARRTATTCRGRIDSIRPLTITHADLEQLSSIAPKSESETSSEQRHPPHPIVSRHTIRRLSASDFRVEGELLILAATVTLVLVALSIASAATVGILFVLGLAAAMDMRARERRLLSGAIQVSETIRPDIYALAVRAASELDMPLPQVFVEQDRSINAYAIGFFSQGSVVLTSGAIEALAPSELLAVIGHEFAHIKCGHTTWLVFTNSGSNAFRNALASLVLQVVFLAWSRKGEHTADRGGLIACRNLRATVSMLAKLGSAGTPVDAEKIEAFLNPRTSHLGSPNDILSTHPSIANRIRAVVEFSRSHTYHRCRPAN